MSEMTTRMLNEARELNDALISRLGKITHRMTCIAKGRIPAGTSVRQYAVESLAEVNDEAPPQDDRCDCKGFCTGECRKPGIWIEPRIPRGRAEDMACYYRAYCGDDLDGSDAANACRAYEEIIELHRELGPLRRLYDSVNRLRLMTELDHGNEDRGQLIDGAVIDAIETMKECDHA